MSVDEGIHLQLIFNRDGELHPNPAFFARGEFSNEKQMIQGGGTQFPSLSRGLIRIRMDNTRLQTLRSSGKTLVHFAKFGFRNHFLIFGLSWLRRCSFNWRELEPYRDGTRHIEILHRKNLQGIETGWSRWLLPVDIDLIHTRVMFLQINEAPPDTHLFHPDTPFFHPPVSSARRQRSPRERAMDGTGGRAGARPAAFSPDPTQKEPSLLDGTLSPLSLAGDRDERPIWARRTSSPDAPLRRTRTAASFSPPVFPRSPLKNLLEESRREESALGMQEEEQYADEDQPEINPYQQWETEQDATEMQLEKQQEEAPPPAPESAEPMQLVEQQEEAPPPAPESAELMQLVEQQEEAQPTAPEPAESMPIDEHRESEEELVDYDL
uniref:Uncharacterized protein n=1 Tax=Chromera velia CCMP2878 TaxID=1169474 RepID=A0A0G4FN31_9ALVE|eukprot:Cvel_17888.t1-p1 / transcript=Cvel_17888.t1 / gene=Cvel_17888 / organism=Chromera_velia_CCMP2878 / gene_product=hypothetical protein / transcript_product=hypothetical protein / location=Cvel_scaffold1451:42030-43169(-) / protein_length=380 / sequence_SO=supercontig / SO=protein_coding / is_pseudo=false